MSVITDLTFWAKVSISLSLPICTSPKCKEIWGELLFDWEFTVPVIAGRKYSVQSSLILYSWPASTTHQLARPPIGLLTADACSPHPHQRLAIASFAALILSQTALILSEIQPIAELAIFLSPLKIYVKGWEYSDDAIIPWWEYSLEAFPSSRPIPSKNIHNEIYDST